MTAEEITVLRADLAYRYKNYVNDYVKSLQAGYSNNKIRYNILILSGYIYLIEAWDIDYLTYNINLLTATEMDTILYHINILLGAYYTYKF